LNTTLARLRRALAALFALAMREIGILAGLALAAGGVLAFAFIAEEIREDEPEALHAFDQAVLLGLRSRTDPADPIGPFWLEIAARDITSLGSAAVLFLVLVLALGYLLVTRRAGPAVLLVVAVGGGQILSSALKLGFARVRPDLVPHSVDVYTASFPSGHAMLSAVTYLTLGAILASVEPQRRRRAYVLGAAVFLTVLIGMSRVYLGVHWPTDVLAGWCIGAAWAALCWTASVLLQRRFAHGPAERLPADGVSRR
jgi:undecaprenyl-diphosphatase